jgi:hypothetical protein
MAVVSFVDDGHKDFFKSRLFALQADYAHLLRSQQVDQLVNMLHTASFDGSNIDSYLEARIGRSD